MNLEKPWWQVGRKEMGEQVMRLVNSLKTEQAGRRARYIRNLEFYEGRRMAGYSAHSYNNYSTGDVNGEDSWDLDRKMLIRSMVNHAVAEIYGKQKPKPQFQTLGATWKIRRKAYKLDRISEGVLNQRQGRFVNVWAFMNDAGVEAALQGVACIKVTADRSLKRIKHVLRPLPDLFVDPVEGRDPQNLFERAPIDENEALELWGRSPEARRAIQNAKPYEWFGSPTTGKTRAAKTIEIIYAYHLPAGPDSPGKWCAVINDWIVDEGDWTAPSFPFVFLIWERHRDGFWGAGIADEMKRMAAEVGELEYRLMRRELTASGVRVYYQGDSVDPENLIGNDEVTPVAVEGSVMPVESVRVPFSEMELNFLQFKERAAWDAAGLSQVSASARREANVSSGIGMLTLNETKAGRQIEKAKRFEQAFVDLAHQYVWRLRELKEEDPDIAIEFAGKTIIQRIKFDSADPEDADELRVSVAPASALSHDPAQRQEMISILYSQGVITQEQYKDLLGWADFESTLDLDQAQLEFFDRLIDKYLDADEEDWDLMQYYPPEGHIINKTTVLSKFTNAMFNARNHQLDLPDEEAQKVEFNIELLERFIKELVALMQPPPAPGPDVAAASQNAPPGQLPQLAPPPAPGPQQKVA